MFIQTVFVSLVLLLLGLSLCIAGYRLFLLLLPLFGFFAGFLVTAEAIQELFGVGFLSTASSWVFGFVIGALCAVAAYLFYVAAIVILAATVGYEVGVGIMTGLGVSSGILQFLVGLAIAVALTVLVVVLNLPKAFIVVLTALAGASMILTGILLALGRVSLVALDGGVIGAFIRESWLWLLVYVAITAVGIVAQMFMPETYLGEPYSVAQAQPYTPNVPSTPSVTTAPGASPSAPPPTSSGPATS